MTSDNRAVIAFVPLSKNLVDAFLNLHAVISNELACASQGRIEDARSDSEYEIVCSNVQAPPFSKKYTAEFLGVFLTERTLPEVFACIVNMTYDVAPEVLEKLALVSCRKRRFVARTKEGIHL